MNKTLSILLPLAFVAIAGLVLTLYWQPLVMFIVESQQQFHQALSNHIKDFQEDPLYFGSVLALVSLAYGIFHAAGPGHGKAVLVTYLTTQKETARRGIRISFAAALLQSIVAIVLVGVVSVLLNETFKRTNALGNQVEQASYLLVLLVGVYLSGRTLWRWARSKKTDNGHHTHSHSHAHHDHGGSHEHHHDHEHGDHCNHTYVPVAEKQSMWQTLAVIFSMGMRPCSGAVVVLIYAQLVGVFWVGITATLLMGLGTGATVALLGWFAISARDWLQKHFALSESHSHHSHQLGNTVSLLGGLILIGLGWSLFQTSRQILEAHPLF